MAGHGGKRPGAGRPKGKLGRNTEDLARKLEALGCDPFEGMVELAMDTNLDPALRGRMYAELAMYVVPKRKSIEMQAEVKTETVTGPNAESLLSRLEKAATGRSG